MHFQWASHIYNERWHEDTCSISTLQKHTKEKKKVVEDLLKVELPQKKVFKVIMLKHYFNNSAH